MKRIITLLALIIVSLSMSAKGTEIIVDGIGYIISKESLTASVTKHANNYFLDYSGDIVIPEFFDYEGDRYTVSSIAACAFFNLQDLKSVMIPNSVTYIGQEAFAYSRSLTSINIPNGITSIEKATFSECSSLSSVTIPNSVTSIGIAAFSGCTGLTSVSIGNSVTSIDQEAFRGCSGLTSVTIPNSVTSIGSQAFDGCSGLTSLTIGNSVTEIGIAAFMGCSGLTSVTIPNSVTFIEHWAFYGCSSLTSLVIGSGITSFNSDAFVGLDGLTSLTIHCKSIVSRMFQGNSSLKELIIGDEVETIGTYAFDGCSGLTSVIIGNGVTNIGQGAFSSCTELISISIPNSVTTIGEYAFNGCSGLTALTIGSGLTTIGWNAFGGLNGLTSLTIHCMSIDSWFQGNTSLEELIIGDEVETIPYSAFSDCNGLTSVTIGNGVTTIESEAFSNCSGLASLIIGDGVTSIKREAFYNCNKLTSITLPKSVIYIGERAFCGCSGLASVTIGNSVTTIESYAFSGSGLTTVTIPNSVTSIGNGAFSYMPALESAIVDMKDFYMVVFFGDNYLKEITLGEHVKFVHDIKVNKLRCLSQNPPTFSYYYDDVFEVNYLETPYGHSFKYAKDEKWKSVPIIYSVNDNTKYYPIPINYIGGNAVSINGNLEGFEAKEGEEVTIEAYSLKNKPLVMKVTQNISNILSERGSFTFNTSIYHSDNAIYSYDFPLTNISLSESGTLIDKVDIDKILDIENLKISGDINGTDILVIRKMENLKLLDLKDAHIVEGGMSYYKNYVTSKNRIGDDFFSNNTKLYTVILPQDITEICSGFSTLITLSIPKTVRSISSTGGMPQSIHIEDLSAFCSIKFGRYGWNPHDLYLNNKKIVDLEIPNGVTSINAYAFYATRGINSLVIPSTVTNIGNFAFSCKIEKSITCLNPIPPEIDVHTFGDPWNDKKYDNITLYVPKGSKSLYWLHPNWERFKNIVELDESGINDVLFDSPTVSKGVYTIDGVKLSANADNIESLPKGIYIINGEKIIIK